VFPSRLRRSPRSLDNVRAVMVWRRWARFAGRPERYRRRLGDIGLTVLFVGLAGVLALASLVWPDQLRPASVLAVPVLLGGLMLPRRELGLLLLGSVLLVVLVTAARGVRVLTVGTGATFAFVAIVSYEQARRRDRLGVRQARPDQILLELRQRLLVQGGVPPPPPGWGIEVELRSAHDSGMAGDFVASRLEVEPGPDGPRTVLDVVLVDV
jgi:hypothetical protein